MLTSFAIIILCSLFFGYLFKKVGLPSLIGMILTGVLLGPYMLDLINPTILEISPELREFALVVILTRAGLSLNIKEMKSFGRPAMLMCFLPALFEMLGVFLLAPVLFGISRIDALIMGAVISAVSPAVIVPRMLNIIDEGYGMEKNIPKIILAGVSVDDIFVIIMFTVFLSLGLGGDFTPISLINIPISIILGIILGFIIGYILVLFFKKFRMRDSVKLLIMLSISFLCLQIEDSLSGIVPISGLLSIMSLSVTLNTFYEDLAKRLSAKYNKLWVFAELILFVLVGASLDIFYASKEGINAVLLVFLALGFRMVGVYISLIKTNLNIKEKVFCFISYIPKATVQAGIGAIPLSMGLASGQTILTVAVVAILITAPIGAILIDRLYKKLLS